MPQPRISRSASALVKKITQLRNDTSGERNLYPFIRDLLVTPAFGICLKSDQVVVDSALAGGRDIPDLTVFSTKAGRPIKTPDHAYAVFEVKRGHDVSDNSVEIYEEKKKYIKAGTRWFFILDQEEVHKWDVMAKTEAAVYRWEDLTDPERFGVCFAEVRPEHVALEEQLKAFTDGKTKYAFQSIDELGKHHFTDTIREIAVILSGAVTQLVDTKVVPDLTTANRLLQEMETHWGAAVYDWNSVGFPIEFTNIVDERIARTVSAEDIAEYPEAHDRFTTDIEPYVYALRIEKHLLGEYATRMGIEGEISVLKPRRSGSKLTDSGKVAESFIYETASLIVSRMLMVRFSEDHGFLKRFISNGGVEVFARFADYYSKPMQALLKETYRQSAELYRNLFDQNILDWALDSSDENLSSALLHAMYLLSRWDFKAIHGDILSGVYDHSGASIVANYPVRQMMQFVENIAAKQISVSKADWVTWCTRLEQCLIQAADSKVLEEFLHLNLNPLSPLWHDPFRPAFASNTETVEGLRYESVLKRVEAAWNVAGLSRFGDQP